jgi:O-antigen/teichoic acid export membrane protein
MDLVSLLLTLVIMFAVAWLAKYVIDTFFPEPIRMIAYVLIGVLLLLVLLRMFVGPVTVPLWKVH